MARASRHSSGRVPALSSATVDDWSLEVGYDDESRPKTFTVGDVTATARYEGGAPVGLSAGDTVVVDTLIDGRVASSRLERGDRWADLTWSTDGQPSSFETSEGSGRFAYVGGRVDEIAYDDEVREVTYENGEPKAEATGGDFIDDLFGSHGVFTVPAHDHLAAPWAPWFDQLPAELGIDLPDVVTADDIVSAAINRALPELPLPIAPADDVAGRTARALLAVATPSAFPVSADRLVSLAAEPGETDLAALLGASPAAAVADAALTNLADGPCLLCRAVGAGVGAVKQLGRAGEAIYGFVADSVVGRAAISVAFFVATFAVGALCSASGLCSIALGIVAPLAMAALGSGGEDLPRALVAALLEPLQSMGRGIIELDPAALLSVAMTVAAYRAGASSSSRLASLRARAVAPVCSVSRVVCVSVGRFGSAAEHVVDAQRTGAPRLLRRIDRAGAEYTPDVRAPIDRRACRIR